MNQAPNLPGIGQTPQQLNVDLSQVENALCDKCGNFAFIEVVTFKKLSALVSPTGKEGLVPIPTFMCSECGFISPKFMPVPIKLPERAEESGIIATSLS